LGELEFSTFEGRRPAFHSLNDRQTLKSREQFMPDCPFCSLGRNRVWVENEHAIAIGKSVRAIIPATWNLEGW
jgi:hypothetical protein